MTSKGIINLTDAGREQIVEIEKSANFTILAKRLAFFLFESSTGLDQAALDLTDDKESITAVLQELEQAGYLRKEGITEWPLKEQKDGPILPL